MDSFESLNAVLATLQATVNSVNLFLTGGLASIIVGFVASAIGAQLQMRQTTRREGNLRFHQFMTEYEQYCFSAPTAISQDLNAMVEGWDNLFYNAAKQPFNSVLYLAQMIDRFDAEYLKYISKDKTGFLALLRTRQDASIEALIDLADHAHDPYGPEFQAKAANLVDKVMGTIALTETEMPAGHTVFNEHAVARIRARLENCVATFVAAHPPPLPSTQPTAPPSNTTP